MGGVELVKRSGLAAWFVEHLGEGAGLVDVLVNDARLRVAVYLLDASTLRLVVFDHDGFPEAGTQVPAGGVDAGETLVEAVLRESWRSAA